MKYDITKNKAPEMPNLGKGTECIKLRSQRPQKTCTNPSFRCFSPHLPHISAMQNFSILTAIGRKCADKWV